MTFERLSLHDDFLVSSYNDHIQRYKFALDYCRGKRVLDAGCGVGYGSQYLAANGAKSVLAVDISDAALSEANSNFGLENLAFKHANVENLSEDHTLGHFDIIVNFENIEHLSRPEQFVRSAARLSNSLITSSPNGELSVVDHNGKLVNEFHVKEFTAEELTSLLKVYFSNISLFGQWLTHSGKLRQLRSRELFEQLNEGYYNPSSRYGRFIKRLLGKPVCDPPRYTAAADSFDGDYVIRPLNDTTFPWKPTVLIAVCCKEST